MLALRILDLIDKFEIVILDLKHGLVKLKVTLELSRSSTT